MTIFTTICQACNLLPGYSYHPKTGHPKTRHPKTGYIKKPDILLSGFQISNGINIQKPDIFVRFLNGNASQMSKMYQNINLWTIIIQKPDKNVRFLDVFVRFLD